MSKPGRNEIAEYLATMGVRFQPGGATIKPVDPDPDGTVNVQALLDRLAELNNAPRKRILRHTLLTAPDRFAEAG
ncbi:MAG: hypothetical protein AAFV19_02555 [Pseudomonadota bacterium]